MESAERRIGAVVLAAGMSSRMGEPKMLLEWGDGQTILGHILDQLQSADVHPILVVTGKYTDDVGRIAATKHAITVHNPDYALGEMLSSLKCGLRAMPDAVSAALIVLGDQPTLRALIVREVMRAYRAGKGRIVAPSYQMRRGHPILIDRLYWGEMLALPDDDAPRTVINAHANEIAYVTVEDDAILRDVDTPADYAAERVRAGLKPNDPLSK